MLKYLKLPNIVFLILRGMIKAVVIDDEFNSRETLRQMLHYCCPNVELVGEGDGVTSGLAAINEFKPDIVFLDIRMTDGSGFDLLNKVGKADFKLIFVTAYEDYAMKAFRCNAIDYITKPVDPNDLMRAVEKASKVTDGENTNDAIKRLLDSINKPIQQNKKIVLKTLSTVHVIEIDNIIRCESDRNYTVFHLADGEQILISRSMKEFDDILAEHGFLRVHNSHVINLNYIRRFMKDELIVVLKDNASIPVAYRKKEELLNAIKNL